MEKMEKSNFVTIQELEKYRNKNGFINMDDFFKENHMSVEREVVGTVDRVKDWVTFSDGTRILLKTEPEISIEDGQQYGLVYADLIYNKLANQVGFDTAQTDLIIYNGKKGIYSKDVREKNTSLKSLRDYIGDDKSYSEGFEDITDIEFVHDELFEALKKSGISNGEIREVINSLNKLFTLDIFCMSTDNHTENIGFLEGIDSEGNKTIKLSKIFDRENSLAIDISFSNMEKITQNIAKVADMVRVQDPRIAVIIEDDIPANNGLDSFLSMLKNQVKSNVKESTWEMTLDYLEDYPQIHDFIISKCMNLDISKAIKDVEKDIKAPLPKCVKDMASKTFEERKEQISYYLGLDIDIDDCDIDLEKDNKGMEKVKKQENNIEI